MIVWGVVLIAIGIGALLGWNIWPLVLISVGAVLLFGALTGTGRRSPSWYWNCCPWFPERSSDTNRENIIEESGVTRQEGRY